MLSVDGTRVGVELRCLESIRMNVAPWWLAEREGDVGEESGEIAKELGAAKKEVEDRISELRALVDVGEGG